MTDEPTSTTPATDEWGELLDQVDRDIVGWRPEAGDKIFGIVVDLSEGESDFGTYPLIVIDSPDHENLVGVHCFHQILKKDVLAKMARGTLVIGSRIAVSYRGEGEAASGKSAPNFYRVAVRPPSVVFEHDAVTPLA